MRVSYSRGHVCSQSQVIKAEYTSHTNAAMSHLHTRSSSRPILPALPSLHCAFRSTISSCAPDRATPAPSRPRPPPLLFPRNRQPTMTPCRWPIGCRSVFVVRGWSSESMMEGFTGVFKPFKNAPLCLYKPYRATKSIAQTLKTEARRMAQARNILIVGGGTVGAELAAEAVWRFPKGEKQVGRESIG